VSSSCGQAEDDDVSQGRRSLQEFRGEDAFVRDVGAQLINARSEKQQEVNMVDAGMYAAASFAILLISGVAARKLFISSGLKAGEFGSQVASEDVSIKGADGDDGLDNVRRRRM